MICRFAELRKKDARRLPKRCSFACLCWSCLFFFFVSFPLLALATSPLSTLLLHTYPSDANPLPLDFFYLSFLVLCFVFCLTWALLLGAVRRSALAPLHHHRHAAPVFVFARKRKKRGKPAISKPLCTHTAIGQDAHTQQPPETHRKTHRKDMAAG